MRYELTDYEWAAIKPMLPDKPRGVGHVAQLVGIEGGVVSGVINLESSGV